jgi:hypothetical protein
MELRQLFTEKIDVILDPVTLRMTAPEFIAEFGGSIERVNVVVKHPFGNVFYNSKVAPLDPSIGEFFTKIIDVAGDIIEINAVVSTLLDSYMAMDMKYASYSTNMDKSNTHICPVVDATINYLSDIIKEVAAFPVKSIVLSGNSFINHNYCFCESCRKEFSVVSGLSEEFDYNRISINPELLEKWIKWKSDTIQGMLNHLVNLTKQTNDDLDVNIEIYWDPSTNFKENMELEYGQKIEELASKFNTVLNIYPWSPVLPKIDTAEYNQLLEGLSFTKGLNRKGLGFSILYWSIDNEDDLYILKSIARELGASKIYTYNQYPKNYTELREIHLGR